MSDNSYIAQGVRPPQVENPMDAYGKMLSLRQMQTQQAQEAQMNPLRLQEAQLTIAAQQRKVDDERKVGEAWQKAYKDTEAETAATPKKGNKPAPAAVAPSVPTAVAPIVTQPLSSLQAGARPGDEPMPPGTDAAYWGIPPAPTTVPGQPDAPTTGPGSRLAPVTPTQPIATPTTQPLSSLQTADSTASPEIAPRRKTFEDRFSENMAAQGMGADAGIYLQKHAIAQEAQMRAREMQSDENDRAIAQEKWPESKFDPKTFYELAAKAGMSQKGINAIKADQQKTVTADLKARSELSKVEKEEADAKDARADKTADRANSFLERTDQDMKDNWKNFVQQLYADKLSTPEEHEAEIKANNGVFPGRSFVKDIVETHASHKWRIEERKAAETAATLAETKVRNKAIDADRDARLVISQQNADRLQAQGVRETNAQRDKDDIFLASEALQENNDNGGKGKSDAESIDNTIKSVSNRNFYKGHPVDANRGGVIKALQAMKRGEITMATGQAKLDDAAERKRMLQTLSPGGAKATTGGGRGSPAPEAPRKAPATAPASAKYTEAQVRTRAAASGRTPEQIEQIVKAAKDGGMIQ